MAGRPKKEARISVPMESVPIDSEFLTKVCDLLVLMSPGYPGFPSLTLAEKLQKNNYALSRHEQNFLLTTLDALGMVAFSLRLNDLSPLIEEVKNRIVTQQASTTKEQEAKKSLSFPD